MSIRTHIALQKIAAKLYKSAGDEPPSLPLGGGRRSRPKPAPTPESIASMEDPNRRWGHRRMRAKTPPAPPISPSVDPLANATRRGRRKLTAPTPVNPPAVLKETNVAYGNTQTSAER